MNYSVCIPSHKRSDIIEDKVLSFLQKHNIPKEQIYIFVAPEEIETYSSKLPSYQIVEGENGIGKQREKISDYFEQNHFIVTIDDDVCEIMDHGKLILNLDIFIKDAFHLLLDNQLTLAGVYPVNNEFFTKDTITTDLRFCIGQFKIFINKKQLEKRDYNLLEDYENSIKHYCYGGGVLRFNYITLKANYNSGKGGLKEYRTTERKLYEVKKFVEEYSQYARSKKDGFEVQLNKNAKRDIIKSLWIGNFLNNISELTLMSFLRLDYQVELYIDTLNLPKYMEKYKNSGQLVFKSIKEIMPYDFGEEILPYSDLFRYKLLHKTGGTWCDMDMVLLKRLPKDDIIISSEHTMQSGAFKSKLTFIQNIGVLRFPKGDQFLENLIFKIEHCFKPAEFCDNMNIFRKMLKNHEYFNYVSPPNVFCPLPFWQSKESYYEDHYKIKYSVKNQTNDEMINKATAIHCWNNFTTNKHSIDFSKIHPNSLYSKLYNIIFN
tara:strand:- start:255 stop:1724 length:1470 start_codon:yes stop_codon:yes gene_type:complete